MLRIAGYIYLADRRSEDSKSWKAKIKSEQIVTSFI
jgi:hypothetical protein